MTDQSEKKDTRVAYRQVDFDPFSGSRVLCTAPATEPQKEMWAALQLGDLPANCAYNESMTFKFQGPLKVEALVAAFQDLVHRHEGLRILFSPDGETLLVSEPAPVEVPQLDISGLPPEERAARQKELLREEATTPFDVVNGPLWRCRLVKTAADAYDFIFTAHHIICDGWSFGVLIEDLDDLYTARHQGRPADLPAPDAFSRYAREHHQFHQSDEYRAMEAYWLEQFAQPVPVMDLPIDRPRPAVKSYNADRIDREIDPEMVKRLKTLGAKNGCSFVVTLLAAFKTLLLRLTGESDLVVGLPAAGQAQTGQFKLVGHGVEMLPVRSQIQEEQSFREYMKALRNVMLDAFDHQRYTFGSLVKQLHLHRDPARIPLIPVVFNVDQRIDKLNFAGLDIQVLSNPRRYENFEIFMNAGEYQGSFIMEWSYNTDLFSPEMMNLMLEEFDVLQERLTTDPDQKIADVDVLSEREKTRLLEDFNQTRQDFPSTSTLHQLFEKQADLTPNRIALVFGGDDITYQALNQWANQVAHRLTGMGVAPGDVVGIHLGRSIQLTAGLLGILKAGAVFLLLDAGLPAERLEFLCRDSGLKVVITDQRLAAHIPQPDLAVMVLNGDCKSGPNKPRDDQMVNPMVPRSPEDPAYVIYTSGSTGAPKGVVGPHRGLVNRLAWMWKAFPFQEDDVCCQKTALGFVDMLCEVFGPLCQGVKTVILPENVITDIPAVAGLIARYRVTRLVLVPSFLQVILDMEPAILDQFRSIRIWTSSGEELPAPLVRLFYERFPQAVLLNLYGASEVAADVTWYDTRSLEPAAVRVPIGRPISNTAVYCLDAHHRPVPIGVPGELLVGGLGLAAGYLNRPELTRDKFIPDPFRPDTPNRLYKTGDIGRFLPNGLIEYLGRTDYQVKIRGFRIEPAEIETALQEHPDIARAAVTVDKNTAGDPILAAYYVLKPDRESNTAQLRSHLRAKLPEYMIPQYFIPQADFPLTISGKVDRQALVLPDVPPPQQSEDYQPPRSDTETIVAGIWSEVLGVEKVGLLENFFDLGGHSLLAIRTVKRIRDQLGVALPPVSLFELQTVQSLAQRIEAIEYTKSTADKDTEETDREEFVF